MQEKEFYQALHDLFVGKKIEGKGGFVKLWNIKSQYYKKMEEELKPYVDEVIAKYNVPKEEIFEKLYSFFKRYFSETGSIYLQPDVHDEEKYVRAFKGKKDTELIWRTQDLYYIKSDKILTSRTIEVDGFKFYFDVSDYEYKKANERRNVIFELYDVKDDKTIHIKVKSTEKNAQTNIEEILKQLREKQINIDEKLLKKAFRKFNGQKEYDFYIHKNAKEFLKEEFKLWCFNQFWNEKG